MIVHMKKRDKQTSKHNHNMEVQVTRYKQIDFINRKKNSIT
jgi:hypothetical protein